MALPFAAPVPTALLLGPPRAALTRGLRQFVLGINTSASGLLEDLDAAWA